MPKKMTDIDVLETSGVDHPAHKHEGFAVMKSANPETASAILRALGKEPTMTQKSTSSPGTPDTSAVEAAAAEAVQKAIDSKLQPILDSLAQSWKDLREFGEQADTDTPSGDDPAAAAAAAPAAGDVAAATELLKSAGAPEALQAIVKSFGDRAEAAEKSAKDALAKAAEERDARLDAESIAEFRKSYGNLALNAEEYGPALRRLALSDANTHKSVTAMLTAQNEAADGASLFGEVGTSITKSAGYKDVEARAQGLVDAGQFDTIQKARAHVYETDPEALASARQGA